MPFKKTALLSTHPSTYICWSCLTNPTPPSPIARSQHQSSHSRKRTPNIPTSLIASVRTYATTTDDSSPSLQWPDLGDPRRIPTPYQIFNHSPTTPYSKRRFYELVKIYHPDRTHTSPSTSSSHQQNLERYRLVIAANHILSDPSKRSAYDRHGAGWATHYEPRDANKDRWRHHRYSTYRRWQTEYRTRWGEWSTDGDAMFNATWEDWERWYERQRDPAGYARRHSWSAQFFSAARPHGTVFANNYVFLSVVAFLAALGGVGQATRANQLAENRKRRLDAVNERVGRDLLDARDGAREDARRDSKEERIKRWVRQKEGLEEGDVDGRVVGVGNSGDFCGSGMMKDRDEVPFWKRPPEEWER